MLVARTEPNIAMNRQQKIRVAILVGLGLAATFSSRRGEGAQKTAARQRAVTLNVWIMPNAPSRNGEQFLELIRPFTLANPRVNVVPTVLPWGVAWDKIQGAVSGGPAPDLMQLGTTWVAAIAATGKLADLSGKYDESLFPPQVLATTMVDGQRGHRSRRFALPWIVDTRALYYNKAACVTAGVDPDKDFATWASFKAALTKLNGVEVDGKPIQALGIPRAGSDVVHNSSWWIWGAGGGFVARTPDESGINSPGSLEGIDYYLGLISDGLASSEADRGDTNSVADMLRKGEIATTIAFPIPALPDDQFGVALVPAGPKGRFTFLGGSTLAILKSSKHPEEAIALIKFLSSEAAQLRYSTLTGLLPAAAAEYEELLLKLDPVRAAFVEQMRYGKAYPSISQWGDIENILREGLNAVWDLAKKPGDYDKAVVRGELDTMAKRIDDVLRAPSKARSK